MIKYLPILLLWACNSSYEKATPITVSEPLTDSLSLIVDSLKEWTEDISSVSSYAIKAQERIKQLEKQKQIAEVELNGNPVYLDAIQSNREYEPTDDKDKEIYRLRQQIKDYEIEISKLKNRLFYDSMARVGKIEYDRVPNELKPNEKSLVITLNKKLRGDGDISEQGVSVWIMKYNKKAKKIFKGYESCQIKDLNLLNAKEASYYQGQYFFNDIEPGEYLVKVCALYGNWMVINKKDYKQEIEILMSPPIQ
jgi:hypothetical protein